ncbi:P-II family nitrogen regulator [Magnetospirillum sp. UT-4]|uniref:P-II family nitrogen regulator n=1 Tax=Magnetospirillum sp. UT-4 TaxID=2681467 RepID=UPI00137D6835|nr:P-II family nitrogen regulator [Magnetospirillum sp. UT-4]CAA7622650.1 Nitrogen regulatory protein PII [Magnetospirillum sp. UT-4]
MSLTIPILTDVHLITCIVQRGRADAVVQAAIEAGAEGATIHYARGTGLREKLGLWSIAVNAEKEVVTIAVSREQLNFVFERMFLAGKLDTPGMGFIYVTPVEKAATHIPPDILEKIVGER